MWRQFLAYLHETVATPEHIDQAIQGACDAFDTLTAWMAPLLACGHEQPGR
jgi:heme oxygenase